MLNKRKITDLVEKRAEENNQNFVGLGMECRNSLPLLEVLVEEINLELEGIYASLRS